MNLCRCARDLICDRLLDGSNLTKEKPPSVFLEIVPGGAANRFKDLRDHFLQLGESDCV